MGEVATIGLDIAKSVFQVHGVDAAGVVVVQRRLTRARLLPFFEKLAPCLVGIEACATAHHWARQLRALGHEVRLMPPAYVKPYVKRQKNDAADAEAICEAVTRPSMRFVEVKTLEQQGVLVLRQWVGCIAERDLKRIDTSKAVYMVGPAGSLTIHNCRTVHGSAQNISKEERPLLLFTYSSADAMPYTYNPLQSRYMGRIVRGKPARWAHHDPRPCLIPPDWSGGYTSIFALQQGEDWGKAEPVRAYGG